MTPKNLKAAQDGLYDADVITEITKALAHGQISGGTTIEGTAILWLSEKLEAALSVASEAVNAAGGSAAL